MLIFVIDDERPLLAGEERTIREVVPDAKMLCFNDAEDAMAAVTEHGEKPDIVFCDIEMPGMTGLEFAVKLKKTAPDARIIFVTGFSKYAIEAFKVKAHGYLLKPLTADAVREELSSLPESYKAADPMQTDKLQVRCFGHFEVFWHGEPLLFQRKQTKELLAFLVDCEGKACTSEEISAALWENETDRSAAAQRIRNLVSDLKQTLHSIGMDRLLIRSRRQLAIRRDCLECDYYRMLAGDVSELNAFRGEYMVDYSWAELTAGKLYFR